MAAIVWPLDFRYRLPCYIATETSSELKNGGYVQGTVLLVLRKSMHHENVYRDELVQSSGLTQRCK